MVELGDGILSTSTFGSALIAASNIEVSRDALDVGAGVAGEEAGCGEEGGDELTVAMTVSVWETGCSDAAETTCSVATAAAVSCCWLITLGAVASEPELEPDSRLMGVITAGWISS